eukprot:c27525_g1_i1.p1 GENE.c27525_g1_i1~~c27525_g1_i1.p1  ORF type:complete len:157 (+),score=33.08 c27525_g1_i1:105-575(+)
MQRQPQTGMMMTNEPRGLNNNLPDDHDRLASQLKHRTPSSLCNCDPSQALEEQAQHRGLQEGTGYIGSDDDEAGSLQSFPFSFSAEDAFLSEDSNDDHDGQDWDDEEDEGNFLAAAVRRCGSKASGMMVMGPQSPILSRRTIPGLTRVSNKAHKDV